jgi:hypothetical protein
MNGTLVYGVNSQNRSMYPCYSNVSETVAICHRVACIRKRVKPLHLTCNGVLPINTMVLGKTGGNGDRQTFGIGENGDPCPTLQCNHSHAVAIMRQRRRRRA